jgi:hypothetical protein
MECLRGAFDERRADPAIHSLSIWVPAFAGMIGSNHHAPASRSCRARVSGTSPNASTSRSGGASFGSR